MVFNGNKHGLDMADLAQPVPGDSQILIKVKACAVCRTDLHIIDGDLKNPTLPLVPGHEIIGEVMETGRDVKGFQNGDIIGVPWLGESCERCKYCLRGQENLCDNAKFTGYDINGGYAEYTVANYKYCFNIPDNYKHKNAAPLMCAGLIGYRSYSMISDSSIVGLYGFGAAAHIIAQVAGNQDKSLYAFTRPGDTEGQEFALKLGCIWAGDSDKAPPAELDAAIIFAPVGDLIPQALKTVCKGGKVICAGIHMSDIPQFPYEILWGEKMIKSVANLTRKDGEEFFNLAGKYHINTEVESFRLEEANIALDMLRQGKLNGAAVLVMD